MSPIRSMAVVVNPLKTGADEIAERLIQQAKAMEIETVVLTDYPLKPNSLNQVDICCVIGGDGTILGVVREAARADTPILGINLGKIGFLASYTPEGALTETASILQGKFCIDERRLIEAQCNEQVSTHLALNDVVIKSTTVNLMSLNVFEQSTPIAEYSCDGLIFATPTGSTAYNLSAGGPILHPQNCSIAMTPICAHTLSNRSFIFPDETILRVEGDNRAYKSTISIDGRPLPDSLQIFPLTIKMAKQRIRLIHTANYSHYKMLRTKLKWM